MSLPWATQLLAVAALVASGPSGPDGSNGAARRSAPFSLPEVSADLPGESSDVARADEAWVEREAHLMGTLLRLRVAGPDRAGALSASEAALAAVERLEARLSTWRSDTEMARANRAEVGRPVPLSPALSGLLAEAFRWAQATAGAFDPAVGALVDAWDLRGTGRLPSPPELARALVATGRAGIRFDPSSGTLTRLDEAAWVDAGAFGKGAALTGAAEALEERGVERAVLDFGGQILVLGSGAGDATGWPVAVADPWNRGRPVAALRVRGASVATTGTSERFVEVDGERLGHVLDPRTGRPVPSWGSVTVVARDPVAADALSTALYVLGADGALEWARDRHGLGVLVLERDRTGQVRARWSPGMERWLDGTVSPEARGTDGGQRRGGTDGEGTEIVKTKTATRERRGS